MDMYN